MIDIHRSKKGTPFVWASHLHNFLEVSLPIQNWFPSIVEYGFTENEDFSFHRGVTKNSSGEFIDDWAVRLDMAKHAAMLQKNERGRLLRDYLVTLDNKVQAGEYLNHKQLIALLEICKVLGFFTVQKHLESQHYNFLNKPKDWWAYRSKLLGYDKDNLREMVETLGIKYKNQRQALFHIDRYELIRQATIDLFIQMGKPKEYAINLAKFAQDLAKEMKVDIYNDEGIAIDFKSPEQNNTILKLNNNNGSLLLNF